MQILHTLLLRLCEGVRLEPAQVQPPVLASSSLACGAHFAFGRLKAGGGNNRVQSEGTAA